VSEWREGAVVVDDESHTQVCGYESGLQEDLKSSEYERRLHLQLVAEYQVSPPPPPGGAPGGGGAQAAAGGGGGSKKNNKKKEGL